MRILFLFALLMMPFVVSAKCMNSVKAFENEWPHVKWRDEDGNEDNTALMRFDVAGEFDNRNGSFSQLDYEALVRPDENGTFQILPVPLFMVEMEKKRDSIYICGHIDTKDSAKTIVYVYFLRYGQVRPVTPMPLPLAAIKNLFWGPLKKTPFVIIGIPVTIAQKIQAVFMHIFGDLTKAGVDRVRITASELHLYSGGDPEQFEKYAFHKVIPLATAENEQKNAEQLESTGTP